MAGLHDAIKSNVSAEGGVAVRGWPSTVPACKASSNAVLKLFLV